ncbi:MAG TPA: O-antigen ligase family protein [Xanthobacteraceae bacterium]|jgi:O-antigen ligase|nr:O-antigen ligase family protein [Xanthobacteraceae bacterium]
MGFRLGVKPPADGGVALARTLLLGVVVTMLVSTSLAIGFELAAYIVFVALPEPRLRLCRTLRYPVVAGIIPLAVVIVAATFYGAASWADAIGALAGWRRLLLLPLAAAVFDDEPSKRLVLKVIVVTCLVGALASLVIVWGRGLSLPAWLGQGVVFRNYAVQGTTFSVAAIICIAALLRPEVFAGDRWLGRNRVAIAAVLAVLLFDIVFVLVGRSGYVTIIVMTVVIVALLARGVVPKKALAAFGVLICVGAILASSEHVRTRVDQAFREIASADEVSEGTSLGQRVVMWRNTVRMIRDHPVLGVGTGGFRDGYRPYAQNAPGWQGFESGDPHNQFLKIQAEQGILGLAALLFFIFRALTCPAPTPYRQLAVAVLIGWCATSLANSHFSTFVEGRLLFFWLGAMLADRSTLNGAESLGRV